MRNDTRAPSPARGEKPGLPGFLAVAVWLIGSSAHALGSPDGPAKAPVLHLVNGGFVAGQLEASPQPDAIRWQGSAFTEPFEFALDQVGIIQWPAPATLPRPEGEYGFELSGGDVLFGSLAALDGEHATLDVPRFGRIRVARSHLHRIQRWGDGADLIYYGPSGLSEWKAQPPEGGWREEAGQPVTERAGATLRSDLGLPAKATVEFEISWKSKPDFALALGLDAEEGKPKGAEETPGFRFETWGGDLVVVRETARGADLTSVGTLAPADQPGRIHLIAYVDQERGRILVDAPDGRRLADLTVPPEKPHVGTALSLSNVGGDVRLERLAIRRWDGEALPAVEGGRPHLVRNDGSTVFGDVARFDADAKEFVVGAEGGETRVPAGEVAAAVFSAPREPEGRDVRVVYQDGTRLSGALAGVADGSLELRVPGIEQGLHAPAAGLRSLVVLRHGDATPPDAGILGRLELDGTALRGVLIEARERPESSCLTWKPLGSGLDSPLRHGASGRIVYKEPKPAPTARATPLPPQQARPAPAGVLQRIFPPQSGGQVARKAPVRPMLYLRSGDIIPAEVTKIDEDGLRFESPVSENAFVPHDKIKAVVLGAENAVTVQVSKTKRERLLTLPRMQRGSPPTHLIRSRNGDYLRGRLVGMDGENLRVEIHLEEKSVPREFVTRIVWLHADEVEPLDLAEDPKDPDEPKPAEPEPSGRGGSTRVQAVRSDGIRLTFFAERGEDGSLVGKSDVLGDCRVPLDEVDQFVFGDAIEREAAQLAYNRWKLQNAPDPKTLAGGEPGADGTTGMESALVGKPAPDFTLDLLGGKAFHLAESKGQVVVLDFWATWCGPCLQSMPQVEEATREFRDRGVKLIAVNLQEAPDTISAMLERHKLPLTVVLDRDGAVAQKYGANAIPQTVIIDREGNVARLYIGASPHLGEQIRTSIEALLADDGGKAAGE